MWRPIVRSGVLAVICLMASASARAAEGQPPCLADVKRLCGRVPPTGNFVQGCLEERRSELSKECRGAVDDLTRQTTVIADACRWDLARFCSNVANVAGEHVTCLVARRDALSPKCRETLGAEPAPPPPSGSEGAAEVVAP